MKAYLINLDDRPDRLQDSLNKASLVGLDVFRVPAIQAKNSRYTFVTPTVGACFDSHRKAWQLIADSSEPYGIILEDDFKLSHINQQRLYETVRIASIDLLQIGFLKTGFRDRINYWLTNGKHLLLWVSKFLMVNLHFRNLADKVLIREIHLKFPQIVPADIRAGAHCYLISRAMARDLTELNKPVFLAADDFLIALARMRTFSVYRLFMSKCGQSSSPTSISSRFKKFD